MGGEEQVPSFSCFFQIQPYPSANAPQVQEVARAPGWAPPPSLGKGVTLRCAKRNTGGAVREGDCFCECAGSIWAFENLDGLSL